MIAKSGIKRKGYVTRGLVARGLVTRRLVMEGGKGRPHPNHPQTGRELGA